MPLEGESTNSLTPTDQINHCSGSNWRGLASLVDGDIHDFSLGHAHSLVWRPRAFRFYGYTNQDRRAADLQGLGVEANEVANKNRGNELDLVHGRGHQPSVRMLVRLDRARQVERTEDDATKDSPQIVRVTRHHNNANRGLKTAGLRDGE